jgi:hypothetical protein
MIVPDMPHDDEHLPRNRRDRLCFAQVFAQMVKAPFPVTIMNLGHPRRFHHGTAQIAPPLFGDAPAAVFVGGIMDAADGSGMGAIWSLLARNRVVAVLDEHDHND